MTFDSQIYRFFLDKGPGKPGVLLFTQKLDPQRRPHVGDSMTLGPSFENFRVTRDEFSLETEIRVTDDNLTRITDDGRTRITGGTASQILSADQVTHNYFLTPANNPQRIVSWTTNTFEFNQTLRQLFQRDKVS